MLGRLESGIKELEQRSDSWNREWNTSRQDRVLESGVE